MRKEWDVIVVGGGPAGLAAALACSERGIPQENIVILERDRQLGGILQQCIHHGFGLHLFGEELTGPEYAQRFIDRVQDSSIVCKTDTMVLEITNQREVVAVNAQDGLMVLSGKAIILAMGCRERTRGALNIPGTRPAGVYTAGCAQRLVNMEGYMPGKEIVILGSGDIGLIMARRLTWEGAKVKLVCELMPYSSGLTRNIVQCLEDNDIPLRFEHTVVQIHGKSRVEGVTIARVDGDRKPIPSTFEYIPCDTLLLSVGLLPENELTEAAGIQMDSRTRGAMVDQHRQCSVEGIFACGNVLHVHDLVDNVSMEAQTAGIAAADYIMQDRKSEGITVSVQNGSGVSYTVPQRIVPGDEDVDIYLRTRGVFKPATLTIQAGDKMLLQKKKSVMTPGEMEKVTLPAEKLQDIAGTITVSVIGG